MKKQKYNYDIFISYSHSNLDNAKRIASYLDDNGFKIWFDYWNLSAGDNLEESLKNAIKQSRIVLVLIDKNSLDSKWTEAELKYLNKEKILLLIEKESIIDTLPNKLKLNRHCIVDYKKLDNIIEELKKIDEYFEINPLLKIANIEYDKGNYDLTLLYYKRVLEIQYKILGEEHLSTATSYNNLAECYNSMGEYEKAEQFYLNALKINEKILGDEHPNTATNYNNLAICYYYQTKYTMAYNYMKKVLKIWSKILPKEHPNLVNIKENIEKIQKIITI